jgi:hypothetical protein
MFETFTAGNVWPFSLALMIFVSLFALQVVNAVMGVGFEEGFNRVVDAWFGIDLGLGLDHDHDSDLDSSGFFQRYMSWICWGKVPALIGFTVLLHTFGFVGLFGQHFLHAATGYYLWWPIAVVPAFMMGSFMSRFLTGLLAQLLPDTSNSDALSQEEFIGQVVEVTLGPARRGLPGRAFFVDQAGTRHVVPVEPDADDGEFPKGSHLLLVGRAGSNFLAIENPSVQLTPEKPVNVP